MIISHNVWATRAADRSTAAVRSPHASSATPQPGASDGYSGSAGLSPVSSTSAAASRETTSARAPRLAALLLAGMSILGGATSALAGGPLSPPMTQAMQSVPAPSATSVRQTRDSLVDAMIVRDARVGAPSAQDVQRLKDALSGVDTEVLQYARSNGTRWVIVQEGQNLADAGVVRPQHRPQVLAEASNAATAANGVLREAHTRFDGKLGAITDSLTQLNAMPEDMGGPGPGPALSRADDATSERINKLYQDLRSTQSAQKRFARTQLEQRTGDRVKLYNPAEGEAGGSTTFRSLESINTPHTLEQMARMHGAQTPAEIGSFVSTVKTLNRDALPALQAQGLQRIQSRLAATRDPAQRQQLIDLLAKGPDAIPLDHENNLILVPNTYDYRPAGQTGGEATVVDYHDYASLQQWNDASGRIKHADPKVYTVSAEHFDRDGMNTIVIRSTALTPQCAVHELGHSVEGIIERTGTPFGKQLEQARESAYENPPDSGYITDYAATSANENMAEGFAMRFNNPSQLRAKDPALSRLIDGEIAFIRTQAAGQQARAH